MNKNIFKNKKVNFICDTIMENFKEFSNIFQKDFFLKYFFSIDVFKIISFNFNDIFNKSKDSNLSKSQEKELFFYLNKYLFLIYYNFLQIPLFLYYILNFMSKKEIFSFSFQYDLLLNTKSKSIYCKKHSIIFDNLLLSIKSKINKVNYNKDYFDLFLINYCRHELYGLIILFDINFYRLYISNIFIDFKKLIIEISKEEDKLIKIFEEQFNIKKETFLRKFSNIKMKKFYLIFLDDFIFYYNLKYVSNDIYNIINNINIIEKRLGISILDFKIICWNIVVGYINYNFYRSKIVKYNFRLVMSISKKYSFKNIQSFDIIQEGNLGLIKAIDKFDFTKGYKFSTYATWWIRQSINRFIADYSRIIRLPVHMIEIMNKINKYSKKFYNKNTKEITNKILSNNFNITSDKIKNLYDISSEPISLDSCVNFSDKSFLKDFIKDTRNSNFLQTMSDDQLKMVLLNLFQDFDDREYQVLCMRFGIGNFDKVYTLEEIGKIFGVTRERIRQIENKALCKLRTPNKMYILRNFLNFQIDN